MTVSIVRLTHSFARVVLTLTGIVARVIGILGVSILFLLSIMPALQAQDGPDATQYRREAEQVSPLMALFAFDARWRASGASPPRPTACRAAGGMMAPPFVFRHLRHSSLSAEAEDTKETIDQRADTAAEEEKSEQ